MGIGAAPIVQEHFARSIAATGRFFDAEAQRVAECCRHMADRFSHGGTLLVMGEGAQASDAQHVAVEFVHPVIVGKRALPAISLTSDIGVFTASAHSVPQHSFAGPLQTLGQSSDIVLGICATSTEPSIRAAMTAARERGLLTILIRGRCPDPEAIAEVEFGIDESNPFVVQEVSETLYHVLWELVHVFFETDDAQLVAYLPPPGEAKQQTDLLAEAQASTLEKARDVCALRTQSERMWGDVIVEAGRAIASRIRRHGKLLAIGNGGSATDAQDAAADCLAPPLSGWYQVPAMALTNDVGVLTAIGNDVGFDHVFSRQIIAFARPPDIALGFSTSGVSRNVVVAMDEAKARGLLTIAMSGGDGGTLARSPSVDFCFTVPSEHLPRIQEVHATTWHALLSVVQEELRD
ncbi:MAG: SIS domain-containing protein [Vicinamibacterales bacterium]